MTRGRPEVNHEFKKSYGLLLTLLPKQPLGTPTTFLPTDPPPPPPTPIFFWLSIALIHFLERKGLLITHSRRHISDDTLIITHDDQLSTIFSAEDLSNSTSFWGGKKEQRFVFIKDWINNVASLLTYCSICWPRNNSSKREEFMHSKVLSDVIFLLGSFRAKKIQEYRRDKGLAFLIKWNWKRCTKCQWQHPYYSPSFRFSTCITCLPLNLCLPFTFIRLKHCPSSVSTELIKRTANYQVLNEAHAASAQPGRICC